ncbi:MAG: peptide chain release factor N(5)-glutamine methyltransferase [Gammaproteobacteria bacterium]|nr:peptide chain release factor N(5)-glutamine methyltransferase [Gammaproteobacteria bacterium]
MASATALITAHSDSARLDAEVLLAHVLERDRTWVYTHADETLSAAQAQRYKELTARRADGTPVAYLTNEQEFWSLPLRVSEQTLIPRPDTELLVELALARLPSTGAHVLELGTGTGAIAIALASESPDMTITATDLSEDALKVAQHNLERHGCTQINLVRSRWFDALEPRAYDLIVSNPPYIRQNDPHLLQGDVRSEPRLALTSGADGLDAIREITAGAAGFMRPGAWLLLEHGYDQGPLVRELLQMQGFSTISSHRDLGQHERVTEAQFNPAEQRVRRERG